MEKEWSQFAINVLHQNLVSDFKLFHDKKLYGLFYQYQRDEIHDMPSVLLSRQRKLEEALLFSGQFNDALEALLDWLAKVEPVLGEDQMVHGDIDTVNNLVEEHKVSVSNQSRLCFRLHIITKFNICLEQICESRENGA